MSRNLGVVRRLYASKPISRQKYNNTTKKSHPANTKESYYNYISFYLNTLYLQHSSHYIRLFTLQILQHFPLQHAIVNHDSLDLRDDLDEEHASLNNNTSSLSTVLLD